MSDTIFYQKELTRLLGHLSTQTNPLTVREYVRNKGFFREHLEQAQREGVIRITLYYPKVGRPARVVEKP